MRSDIPIISFKSQKEWEKWLSKNHNVSGAVWIRFYKKGSGIETISYSQALDEALCYGWIDGVVNKYDEASYIQYFCPRRSKSLWSKRNIEHIDRLTKLGKMQEAGIAAYEAAKADGRLERAYDSASTMKIPEDFLKELSKNEKAEEFFKTLKKTNLYFIAWQLQTAKKEETRQKRMQKIIQMLENGDKEIKFF